MLTSTVMKLAVHEDCLLDPTLGQHAHALFLSLIQRAAPEVAEQLHKQERHKPFTVSPLQGRFERVRYKRGVKVKLMVGETYWMRFRL